MNKNSLLKRGFLILSLVGTDTVLALDDSSYALGRYWGFESEEMMEEPIQEQAKATPVPVPVDMAPSAKEVMSVVTQIIDEAKAKAVLDPTIENVKAFIVLKNKAGDMATQFSVAWQAVLLQNAKLDYSAYKPTHNHAIKILNRASQEKTSAFLSHVAKEFGLIYFYEGRDSLSQLQAPIILRLAQKHSFDVLGVAMDGQTIQDFEKNTLDNGQAKRMGVQKLPALFALNTKSGEFMPVSHTLLAQTELEQRLYDVLSHFKDWK